MPFEDEDSGRATQKFDGSSDGASHILLGARLDEPATTFWGQKMRIWICQTIFGECVFVGWQQAIPLAGANNPQCETFAVQTIVANQLPLSDTLRLTPTTEMNLHFVFSGEVLRLDRFRVNACWSRSDG